MNGGIFFSCRMGTSGKMSSTSNAALSAIRRALQLGQNPRRLQLDATSRSLMTVRAAHAQEPVFQAATLEVIIEFPLDILRQGRALCGHLVHKRGIVLLDERVEVSLLWTVAS